MKLVVQSNKSIAELEALVAEKFSAVKNKGIDAPQYKELPYYSENLSIIQKVSPVKDSDSI